MLSSKAKAAFYLVAGALLVPCLSTVGALHGCAWAQPAAPDTQVKAAWEKLQKDSIELEATDPQGAITRYQKFFEETGYRSPAVGVQISLRIARIYQLDLKNTDKAIEIYNWALALYKDQPDAILLQKGRLAALEAQKRSEAPVGGTTPATAQGAAPLAIVPLPIGGGVLGVGVAAPKVGGQLGVGVTPSLNAGTTGVNPFSPTNTKPNGGLGVNLPSTATQKSIAVSLPLPPGNALGWTPGPQRCITALTQQSDGTLWVATEDSGVWRYDPAVAQWKDRWTQFTAKDGLADESAYALAVDQKGRVWAGTLNHGVSVWNGREWKNYGVLDGPLGERIFDIAVCPTDGDVWIATNAGLTRYSQQKDSWSYLTRAHGLPSDQVQAITFDKSGNIILGTQCDGVALSQAADGYKNWRVVPGPEKMPLTATGAGLPTSLINDVLVARDGTIYAATTTGLAWSSDGGAKWAYVRGQDYADKVKSLYGGAPAGWKEGTGAVLAEDYVSCLAQDEAGRLWIGHWKDGSEMVQMQNGPDGLGIKEVSYRKKSGFVKAMLPRDEGALLLARYDQGLSYGSATIEKDAVAPKAAIAATTVSLPTAAKTPTLDELNAMLASLNKVEPLDSKTSAVTALADDWGTQGDWLGRYGRYYARLHALMAPYDYEWGAGDENVPFATRIGKNAAAGDSIRYWVQWLYTDNPHTLEMPPIYYDSRLKKGLAPSPDGSSPKNRRQSELDDHGEVYPMTQDGPHIFSSFEVPKGDFYLSFYDFNKDGNGEDANNRLRDYRFSLRSHSTDIPLNDIDGFESWPELAHARLRDFRGGVYKRFLVRGPQTLTVQISRNYSHNTILAGMFLDQLTEEPEPYFASASKIDLALQTLVGLKPVELTNQNDNVTSATEAEAVNAIWQQLERIKQENPAWLATGGRQVYARLLPWLEQAQLRIADDQKEQLYARTGTCYYQLAMFGKWEEMQKLRGLTTAREVEKSLRWDGKNNWSGQARAAIIKQNTKTE